MATVHKSIKTDGTTVGSFHKHVRLERTYTHGQITQLTLRADDDAHALVSLFSDQRQ